MFVFAAVEGTVTKLSLPTNLSCLFLFVPSHFFVGVCLCVCDLGSSIVAAKHQFSMLQMNAFSVQKAGNSLLEFACQFRIIGAIRGFF